MYRLLLTLACVAACHTGKGPELRVLGERQEVVLVQVSNPAEHAMRLTKLDYVFLADHRTVSSGQLALERDVPAGAAVVVEVPLDRPSPHAMTLEGTLTAQLDEIVRSFQVKAQIQPHRAL